MAKVQVRVQVVPAAEGLSCEVNMNRDPKYRDPTSITQFQDLSDDEMDFRIRNEEEKYFKAEAQRTGLPVEFIKFIRTMGPLEPPETPEHLKPKIDPFTVAARPYNERRMGTVRMNMGNGSSPPPPRNVQPEVKGGFVSPYAQSKSSNTPTSPLMRELQSALPPLRQTTQGASGGMNIMGLNQPLSGEGLHTQRMAPQVDILKFLESYSEPKSWTKIGKVTSSGLVSNRW